MATPPPRSGPAGPDNTAERKVYTVSRLNREVRVLLEQGLAVVWVEGELTNFSQPASGHWYFTLKDRNAQIRCAMFRTKNLFTDFTPEPGQQVLARGRVSLYEPRGDYQLIVEHLEEAGLGALQRQFERLKAKLAAEGLFATETKREIPRFPRRIGLITSPTGAAIRDVLKILGRRFPPADVLVYPTQTQGAAAAPSIVNAINTASARAECDVLILARGGGSLEDLWAFNDERVARAIHACAIPVVTGIGHEIDFTIADFVADVRAPTPSGAAEMVVPDKHACLESLEHSAERLRVAMRRELRAIGFRVENAVRRLAQAHPGARLNQQEQRLDDLEQRLYGAFRHDLQNAHRRLNHALAGLVQHSPDRLVREYRVRHETLAGRLRHALQNCVARAEHRLTIAQRTLHTVSPLATLDRGFAIVTRAADGALVTDVASLSVGDEIDAKLAHGTVRASVIRKE
jgi:exodeoxyribonuclease VII large subunit